MVREDEDIVTVELSLTKPSPCCLQVVVEVEDGSAIGGKLCMYLQYISTYSITLYNW